MSAEQISPEASLVGLQVATSSLRPPWASLLYVSLVVPSVCLNFLALILSD